METVQCKAGTLKHVETEPEPLTEGQHLQYGGWKSLSPCVKGFGGVMLRQIPVADLREIAHLSGREVKMLFS